MNVVVLNKRNWEPSELAYLETHLGSIVSLNTPKSILVSRTPGGWRWYAWSRRRGGWVVVAMDLKEMVKRVLKRQEIEK